MIAEPYNRFVFVSWSWHLSCNGNQALHGKCHDHDTKQSDYMVEQSSFTLIAFFYSKLVVVIVVIGLKETRLNGYLINFLMSIVDLSSSVMNIHTGADYFRHRY